MRIYNGKKLATDIEDLILFSGTIDELNKVGEEKYFLYGGKSAEDIDVVFSDTFRGDSEERVKPRLEPFFKNYIFFNLNHKSCFKFFGLVEYKYEFFDWKEFSKKHLESFFGRPLSEETINNLDICYPLPILHGKLIGQY